VRGLPVIAPTGAKATKDARRDNWRTPQWLMDVLHREFPMLWDATAHGPDEWAHGCEDGNTAPNGRVAEWPTHRPVFCNPPFSEMREWSRRIASHPGQTVTVCKLAPSVAWWRTIVGKCGGPTTRTRWIRSQRGDIVEADLANSVSLWLLPVRVAYEPPEGIKATSPSFDSCVLVRL
jgi:hypothetical protein